VLDGCLRALSATHNGGSFYCSSTSACPPSFRHLDGRCRRNETPLSKNPRSLLGVMLWSLQSPSKAVTRSSRNSTWLPVDERFTSTMKATKAPHPLCSAGELAMLTPPISWSLFLKHARGATVQSNLFFVTMLEQRGISLSERFWLAVSTILRGELRCLLVTSGVGKGLLIRRSLVRAQVEEP